jgi:hypothetical protein
MSSGSNFNSAGKWPSRPPGGNGSTARPSDGDRYLLSKEAAAYLRLSHRTLERYRVQGQGPCYLKMHGKRGRVLYRQSDLDAWIASFRYCRSTSEYNDFSP